MFAVVLVSGCSSEKNTVTSKAYHNVTAHYNGYFYAREEITKIEETIRKSHVDDYNRILRIFPSFDSVLAKGYDKEVQEAVKMASLAIQRHKNSKWVDDSYILVGKARFYSLDWGNAIQTFKYVNNPKVTKNKNARHEALIRLVRTFTEHKEFNNARAAIDFLEKEDLNKTNRKELYLEKALFYQVQNDYDNMVRNLAQAEPYLKKKDRRGRMYFIIGQVYQELGFEAEAYNYYKKCLSTNPEYEVDFYARLYMAQVTEISRSRSVNAARKSFRKLLKDRKNKDFQDKIFYEMGMFELKQKNLTQAIENFNYSIRAGSNTRVDGESYLRLGQIYYDTLKDYEKSQAYYDSAISALPKDYDDYAKIKARQEILNEFVKNLKTIKWQDSLLTMATLDSATLRGQLNAFFDEKKKREEEEMKKRKKRSSRIEINSGNNRLTSQDGEMPDLANENAEWYFGNPSAMSIGQSEFKRIWGTVALEDNWRRSAKSISQTSTTAAADTGEASQTTAGSDAKSVEVNPAEAEYVKLSKEIPRTEEQKQASLKKIEDAYFALGDIYYFKLEESSNARLTYLKLLNRFPKTEYEPEVLYKLYLMHKTSNPTEAEQYASILKEKHPNSTFTKILLNPDYLKESSEAAEKQKVLYSDAYTHFLNGAYKESQDVIAQANALGQTSFTPNLKLLSILIIGETEDITAYQYALEQFIKENPDGSLTKYAKTLLAASKQFALNQEKVKGIGYVKSFTEPHYFVIVFKKEEKLSEPAATALGKFNQQYFKEYKLKTSNLILNEEYAMTMVSELPGPTQATEFRKTFTEKLSTLIELRNHKFDSFVITKDNFNIFYRTKGLDEYLQFFEKNYPPTNQ